MMVTVIQSETPLVWYMGGYLRVSCRADDARHHGRTGVVYDIW